MDSLRHAVSIYICSLLLAVAGCKCGESDSSPPTSPGEVRNPSRLLLEPGAVLLSEAGATHEFTLRAFDADGNPVDPESLELELAASNPEEVSFEAIGAGRIVATALKPVGSAILVVRGKEDETLTSNPVTALVARLKPGVQTVKDDRVVFPPPNITAALNALPHITPPDSNGHVRIGPFSDEEVLAWYELQQDSSGRLTQNHTAVVLRGEAPATGTLLFASEGAVVAGRVVRTESRDDFSLVQIQHVPLTEFFSKLQVHVDERMLQGERFLPGNKGKPQRLRQKSISWPLPKCKGKTGYNATELSDSELNVDSNWNLALTLDEQKQELNHLQVTTNIQVTALIKGKLKFAPDIEAEFRCTLPPQVEFGPFTVPGPLAAFLTFKLQLQPFIDGKATINDGPTGELRAGIEIKKSLSYGLAWTPGTGVTTTKNDSFSVGPVLEREGELFSGNPELLSSFKAQGNAGVGVEGTLAAVPSAAAIAEYIKSRDPAWARRIPFLAQALSLLSKLKLKLLQLDAGGLLDMNWKWIGGALEDKSDEGALGVKAQLKITVLPQVFDFLNLLFTSEIELSGELPPLRLTLWERTAPRKTTDGGETRLHATASSGDSQDGFNPLHVENDDTVTIKVTPAPVQDALVGMRLYLADGGEPTLVDVMQGSGTWSGTWKVPNDFCEQQNHTTLHIIGFNKVADLIPMASHLGEVNVYCEPPPKTASRYRPSPPSIVVRLLGGISWGWGGRVPLCFDCFSVPDIPRTASDSWGDPHLTTFDGRSWTAYALGEYWLLRERPGSPSGGVQVQARHQRLPGFAGWASFNTAIAVRAGNHTFEVRMPRAEDGSILLDKQHELELLINGQQVSLYPQTYLVSEDLSYRVTKGNRIEIMYRDPTIPQPVQHPHEAYTKVRIGTRGEGNLLRTGGNPDEPVVSIDVAVETVGPYVGLLGTPDGNANNDFTTWEGQILNAPTWEFTSSFRLRRVADSLFTYAPGEGPNTFAIPQTISLPKPSELGAYFARVRTLLTDTCGLSSEALSSLEQIYLQQLAYELASGRTEQNLIASGLCEDSRVTPPADVVGFHLLGRVTMAGRPDIGVGGARVRVLVRELGRVLCDTPTIEDGRYGCGLTHNAADYASLEQVTLDYSVSGRGPEVTRSVVIPLPGLNTIAARTEDFEATVAAMLDVRGRVSDPEGVPLSHARVRISSPFRSDVLADEHGRFQQYLALPDGLRSGALQVEAISPDGRLSGNTSSEFNLAGPGVHTIELDISTQVRAGNLPPARDVPLVRMTGTLRNALVQQAYGVSAPLQNVTVRVLRKATSEELCTSFISDTAGRWGCGFELPEAHHGPLELEVAADGLPSSKQELSISANELPGPGQMVTKTVDLVAVPTTLVLEGRTSTPGNVGLNDVQVTFKTLDGTQQLVRTESHGRYRAILSLPFETSFSGPVEAEARVNGIGGVGALEERTTVLASASARSMTVREHNFLFTTGTAVLSGRVLNTLANDAPVHGAYVRVTAAGKALCEATTTAEGFYVCNVSNKGGGTLQLTYRVSGRGEGTFTEFDGQPATLDLSAISAATVQPVLPTRDLRVAPTTVRIQGRVQDAAGLPAPGAQVGATVGGIRSLPVYSADDGTFTIALPLIEGRLNETIYLSAHLAIAGMALKASKEESFSASLPHTRVDLPVTLTLNGSLPPSSSGGLARLRFTGEVTNSLAGAEPVAAARVEVRLGANGPLVCEATTSGNGAYDCQTLLSPAPQSPADFEYSVHLGGTSVMKPLLRSRSFTRSAIVETNLSQSLLAQPTTLEVRGRVTSDGTIPLSGARVSLEGTSFGTAQTNEQGDYRLVTMLPMSSTAFEGRLSVSVNGLNASRVVSGSLQPGALTRMTEDFQVSQRHLLISGTVENLLAPGTQVRDGLVNLRHASVLFCSTLLLPQQDGRYGFSCPRALVLDDASPVTIEWRTNNAMGTQTGTVTLGSAEIPLPGRSKNHSLKLSLAATTLVVQGIVRGLDGRPAPGADIRAAAAESWAQGKTAGDGTYTLTLVLPDALPGRMGGRPAADLGVEVLVGANRTVAGGLVALSPGQLTTVTRDISLVTARQARFSGRVVNANANNQPVIGARVRILREGVDPSLGILCDDEVDSYGDFYCPIETFSEDLASLTVRYEVMLLGTAISQEIVKTYTLRPGSETNYLSEQLAIAPTTVFVTGFVRDPKGTPMASTWVRVETKQLQGRAVYTDATGHYAAALALPAGVSIFDGTVAAGRRENRISQEAWLSPLAQGESNGLQVDLTMTERSVTFLGRLSNALNPEGPIPYAKVELSLDGVTFCEKWTDSSAGNTINYSCGYDELVLPDKTPVNVTWKLSDPGDWGVATGTRAVLQEEIPEGGGTAALTLDISLPMTTLEVSGVVRMDGEPLAGATVRVAPNHGQGAEDAHATTSSDGRYTVRLSYYEDATNYTVSVHSNGISASRSGALHQGALTSVTQDLNISSAPDGKLAWKRAIYGKWVPSRYAPAVIGDLVFVLGWNHISALRLSDGSDRWSAQLSVTSTTNIATTTAVADEGGAVFVGDGDGFVQAFSSTGDRLWYARLDSGYQGEVSALAIGDGLVYAGQHRYPESARVRAHRNVDGGLAWVTDVPSNPTALVLAPDGTLLVSTNAELMALRGGDGRKRWSVQSSGIPAITPDAHILVMDTQDLVKRDLNGREVWRVPLGESTLSPPAVAADGTIFVALDDTLVRVSPTGIEESRTVVVDDPSSETLTTSSPTLGADGSIYLGARSTGTGDSILYALNTSMKRRWSYRVQDGHGFHIPTIVDGRVLIVKDGEVHAVDTGVAGGMASGGWARQYGDASNSSRAPSVAFRELLLTGTVSNSNMGARATFPLEGFDVALYHAANGTLMGQARSDADGNYLISYVAPALDAMSVRLSVIGMGYSSDATMDIEPNSTTGPVVERTQDFSLPITTLELMGTVRRNGLPIVGADVATARNTGRVPNTASQTTGEAGTYSFYFLYEAGAPLTDELSVIATKAPHGGGYFRGAVTLAANVLTTKYGDLELANRALKWSAEAPTGCALIDYTWSRSIQILAGASDEAYVKAYCRSNSSSFYSTLLRLGSDGQTVSLPTVEGAPYFGNIDHPAVGPDGRIYSGTGGALQVLTPELKLIKEFPMIPNARVGRPAVAPLGNGTIRLIVEQWHMNSNHETFNTVSSLDFTPETEIFTPLWSESASGPVSNILIGSAGDIAYMSYSGALHAFSLAPDTNPRVLFTIQGAYDSSPSLALWPSGGGDQIRAVEYDGLAVKSFSAMGEQTAGWPYISDVSADGSSIAVAPDGVTYFINKNGTLLALSPNGTLRWSFTAPSITKLGSGVAVDETGRVYVATSTEVFALDDALTAPSIAWTHYLLDGASILSVPEVTSLAVLITAKNYRTSKINIRAIPR